MVGLRRSGVDAAWDCFSRVSLEAYEITNAVAVFIAISMASWAGIRRGAAAATLVHHVGGVVAEVVVRGFCPGSYTACWYVGQQVDKFFCPASLEAFEITNALAVIVAISLASWAGRKCTAAVATIVDHGGQLLADMFTKAGTAAVNVGFVLVVYAVGAAGGSDGDRTDDAVIRPPPDPVGSDGAGIGGIVAQVSLGQSSLPAMAVAVSVGNKISNSMAHGFRIEVVDSSTRQADAGLARVAVMDVALG